jgi:flagellar FliJ protein
MTSHFPLAGLLRLRRLEEDRAAARYGAASARLTALTARQEHTMADADQIPAEFETVAALRAAAAARASSMTMLGELRALTTTAEAERDTAQREFGVARARTVGLEKLEDRHAAAVTAAELAAEQVVLDELGSSARHRAGTEGAGT